MGCIRSVFKKLFGSLCEERNRKQESPPVVEEVFQGPRVYVPVVREETMRMQSYEEHNNNQGFSVSDDIITNTNDPNKVLDIRYASGDDGAPLIAWESNEQANQQWTIEYI